MCPAKIRLNRRLCQQFPSTTQVSSETLLGEKEKPTYSASILISLTNRTIPLQSVLMPVCQVF
jgi:hypothetical protein